MKTVIPDEMCPEDWRMAELDRLRPVIAMTLNNTMPELVLAVFNRIQWVTDVYDRETSDDGYTLHPWRRHDIALADTIGLIAGQLNQQGIVPKMNHPLLKPLMQFIHYADWETIQDHLEAWYESDLTKILPYLEKQLSVRAN